MDAVKMRAVVDLTIGNATSRPQRSADVPDRPEKILGDGLSLAGGGGYNSFAPWSSG